ncbi:unnamed protein product [Sphenostylis stenocarpa]|uniref:Uncharacterized protein n=1 Tax=Sphenostylis stenocarpa TaxID=92480 RepID=A0AA86SAB4_9FABA|nr:unnamed protein product [Sphenostylis stenocarpa]
MVEIHNNMCGLRPGNYNNGHKILQGNGMIGKLILKNDPLLSQISYRVLQLFNLGGLLTSLLLANFPPMAQYCQDLIGITLAESRHPNGSIAVKMKLEGVNRGTVDATLDLSLT